LRTAAGTYYYQQQRGQSANKFPAISFRVNEKNSPGDSFEILARTFVGIKWCSLIPNFQNFFNPINI